MLNQSKNLLGPKSPQQIQVRENTNNSGSDNNENINLATQEEVPQSSQENNATENADNVEIEQAQEAEEEVFCDSIPDSELVISLENPVQDYMKIYSKYMEVDRYVEDDINQDNFNRISKLGRDTVWNMLFGANTSASSSSSSSPSEDVQNKAGALLNEIKHDSCFHNPFDYNDWVLLLRDELVKRNMKDFWCKFVVPNELGLCWARDSDYFDDMYDDKPAKFYECFDCVAAFTNRTDSSDVEGEVDENDDDKPVTAATVATVATTSNNEATTSNNEATTSNNEAATSTATATEETPAVAAAAAKMEISLATPRADYDAIMKRQLDDDSDNDNAIEEIFNQVRQILWRLLFDCDKICSAENAKKAEDLLVVYKSDACQFSPYTYNDWIVKVRDELFERKNFDFWKNVIVDKYCGLCWFDSDYFDDNENTGADEFYKSGDKLMLKTHATAAGGDAVKKPRK